VLLPLSALLLRASALSPSEFWQIVTQSRALHAYQLSFSMSLAAALLNVVFGVTLAWVLVRYEFPGRSLVDALVDLPFALPTAVAGIALTALYAANGPIGGCSRRSGSRSRSLRSASRWRSPSSASRSWCARSSLSWRASTSRSRRRPTRSAPRVRRRSGA
jgi:ABC-type Fe3+ transport system permease subunit